MHSLNQVLAVILGGGVGYRLYPLTKQRAKPAVPIAGKYRLIDVPISNCINSSIHRVAILTQFNSVSLHRHITQTYAFDNFHQGWVQILAAEQTPRSSDWYQGTADAVRKQLFEIKATGAEYVLILAGDHLYRMDYGELADFHWKHNADISVAVQPMATNEASRFGILKLDPSERITNFVEKPKDLQVLHQFTSREDLTHPYLGSMGIYLFNTNVLIEILETTTFDDFGSQIIPHSLGKYTVCGYTFNGYWQDIGTIRTFYETNLSLTLPDTPFNFYDPIQPIYTRPRYLPGSIIAGAKLNNVLIAEGCIIHDAEISHSIIGLRSQIANGVKMKDTILMGADYYDKTQLPKAIPLGIGASCQIEGAIIDKNSRIGEGVVIRPFPRGANLEQVNWVVQDGIVVIPKDTILQPGTLIEPAG
jgi:glucose-1-phosphate adenylyltransferase